MRPPVPKEPKTNGALTALVSGTERDGVEIVGEIEVCASTVVLPAVTDGVAALVLPVVLPNVNAGGTVDAVEVLPNENTGIGVVGFVEALATTGSDDGVALKEPNAAVGGGNAAAGTTTTGGGGSGNDACAEPN